MAFDKDKYFDRAVDLHLKNGKSVLENLADLERDYNIAMGIITTPAPQASIVSDPYAEKIPNHVTLKETQKQGHVVCWLCGVEKSKERKFQSLSRHITKEHGMTVEDYCEQFHIPKAVAKRKDFLNSKNSREKRKAIAASQPLGDRLALARATRDGTVDEKFPEVEGKKAPERVMVPDPLDPFSPTQEEAKTGKEALKKK